MTECFNISGTFFFDPEDKIYLEHFPGNPVVPGSLIINAFVQALKRKDVHDKGCTINNFRFKQFIPPGVYKFNIIKTTTAFSCKLFHGEKTAVTGEILI